MTESNRKALAPADRLLSLDLFRGLTMFLLIGEFTHLYELLTSPQLEGTAIYHLGMQLHHHPWHGLRFWDLIQPYFIFIVGVAIPFSVKNRKQRGESDAVIRKHAIKRAAILLLLGWALYCIGPGKITFRFQNVLSQIAFTYPIAFFLMRYSAKTQISASVVIIVISEIIYRTFPIPGFDQPFTPNHNFGTWLDMLYGGEDLGGHWVSFNALPTAAHTIWGVVAGQWIMSDKSHREKIRALVIWGIIALAIGYGLDAVTPIIKRISTSTFVFASGGWTLLTLALMYWVVDVLKLQNWVKPFAIVGMNPLFIYLFAHVGGADLLNNIVKPFTMDLFNWTGGMGAQIFTAVIVWYLLWYLCYWLYKKKIFIKI